jgi:cyclic dehypoxanthinyl futalosine synthase
MKGAMTSQLAYLAMIPYANMAPVRALGCPAGFAMLYLTPSLSVAALREGRVVAAALPTGALPALQELVEPLGQYGVAASGSVGSVLLYTRLPLAQLTAAHRVYLTGQSATSVLLLYLLLREDRPAAALPAPTATRHHADAILVIGDEALTVDESVEFPCRYDLATLWHARFQKPLVFCRWVVRREAPVAQKAALLNWLGALDAHDGALVEQCAGVEAQRLGVARAAMVTYLQGMRRVLTPDDLDGQAFFLQKATAVLDEYRAWREPPRAPTAPAQAERLDPAAALHLLQTAPLGELMARAHAARLRRHPGGLVSFVLDTNPNYTNICQTRCTFCAFHRDEQAPDAYLLTAAELADRVRQAADQGATTVLLQGGAHAGVTLARLVAYLRAIRAACPGLHIHPFSPMELDTVARLEGLTIEFVLRTLWDEGVHTIPGGGAEILVERVRQVVSPTKCSASRWLEIMETAHRLGFRTTATMMYGHLETEAEIIEHLCRLRELQDRTGGFASFIAWSFKPGRSPLSRMVPHPAHPALYVRLIAVARLVLDNFPHIQSSWFSESENAGSLGLLAGADDFGGILVEENVLKTTGHARRITVPQVKAQIRAAGFVPARRDSDYRILEVFDP